MRLLYTSVGPLWLIDTATLERRLEFISNLLSAPSNSYEWDGKVFLKDRKKMKEFVDGVKHELRNRRDKIYRQLITVIMRTNDNTPLLVLADRLEDIGDIGDWDKAQEIRKWVDKKNNTKVYT